MSKKGNAVVIDLVKLDGGSIDLSGTSGSIYTESFPLPRNSTFAFRLKVSATVAVKLVFELEQSNVVPATEKAVDASDWAVPDSASEIIADLTDTNVHIIAFPPAATNFGRLKITKDTGNTALLLTTGELSYIPAN